MGTRRGTDKDCARLTRNGTDAGYTNLARRILRHQLGAEITLRRDEALLLGRGRIAFGHSLAESEADAVDFSVGD